MIHLSKEQRKHWLCRGFLAWAKKVRSDNDICRIKYTTNDIDIRFYRYKARLAELEQ